MGLDVCILDAGIMGLSAAVNLQRLIPRVKVTIIADETGTGLACPVVAGLFLPIPCHFKGIDEELLTNVLLDGWRHHFNMAKYPEGAETGQTLLTGFYMWTSRGNHLMDTAVFNYRKLGWREKLDKNLTYPNVCTFTTVQIDQIKYLRWLMKEFRERGGTVVHEIVPSLQRLYGKYDVVVNCVGARSRELLVDPELKPIKGHRVQVEAKWAKNFYITEENISAIPNPSNENALDVGYILEEDIYTNHPDPDKAKLLLNKAKSQVHRLLGCEVLNTFTQFIPSRTTPLIEVEMLNCGGPVLPVVHCLGLGPDALTLAWGLGMHVADLVKDVYRTIRPFARVMVPFGRPL